MSVSQVHRQFQSLLGKDLRLRGLVKDLRNGHLVPRDSDTRQKWPILETEAELFSSSCEQTGKPDVRYNIMPS